jgi:hypothetical protein
MATIYRNNAERVTVAEAKRLILDVVPTEPTISVYVQLDEHGAATGDPQIVRNPSGTIQALHLDNDFAETLKQLGILPRMKYRPVMTDYSGAEYQDETYTIAHDEFVTIAGLFNVVVAVGKAPAQNTTTPAPVKVAVQSTKTRRDALTPVIEHAQSQCRNPKDTAEVWACLQVLAVKKTPPLFGETEGGLQYRKNGNTEYFTLDSLSKRLARQAPLNTVKRHEQKGG